MIDMARRRSRAKRISSSAIVLGVAIGFAAPAQAAKGPGGNDVGTVENLFKITTDAISKYRAEVIWQDESSARVCFKATCGPQLRTNSTTTSSFGPEVTKVAGNDKPGVRTTTRTKGPSGPRAKRAKKVPAPTGKDICEQRLEVTAQAAGKSRAKKKAREKWSARAVRFYGGRWGDWELALDKRFHCGGTGLPIRSHYCIASAHPCLARKNYSGAQKPIN